jgi:hypothetical protein
MMHRDSASVDWPRMTVLAGLSINLSRSNLVDEPRLPGRPTKNASLPPPSTTAERRPNAIAHTGAARGGDRHSAYSGAYNSVNQVKGANAGRMPAGATNPQAAGPLDPLQAVSALGQKLT